MHPSPDHVLILFAKGSNRFAALYHIWHAVPKYAAPKVCRFHAKSHHRCAGEKDHFICSETISDLFSLKSSDDAMFYIFLSSAYANPEDGQWFHYF